MTKFEISMNTITVRDFVSLPLQFFSIVGIKIFKWDNSDVMTTKEKIQLVVTVLNFFASFICILGFAVFEVFEDTFQMLEWALYLCFALIGIFKILFVVRGRKILSRTLKSLEHLFPRTSKERHDFQLAKGYDYIVRHANVMYKSHCTVALMFIIFPFIQSSINYLTTQVFVARIPYTMSYPFDTTHGLGYVVAYISQIICGVAVSCFFLGSDLLLICTVHMVILQFKYLCHRIEHFEPNNYKQDMSEMRDMLEKHNLLNTLAQDLNNVFNVSILLNYATSIIFIVIISIQIVFGSEILHFVKFFGFFFGSTIQIFYVCMFGDQLIEHSTLVGETFAGQKWYMADLRYQRMLTLAIARSQKPAHLTAYKFFIISVESFSNLMTTAYQFFTLLKTRIEEN